MEHIGIDLGSRESQVCIRNGAGDIVEELRCRTDRLVPWDDRDIDSSLHPAAWHHLCAQRHDQTLTLDRQVGPRGIRQQRIDRFPAGDGLETMQAFDDRRGGQIARGPSQRVCGHPETADIPRVDGLLDVIHPARIVGDEDRDHVGDQLVIRQTLTHRDQVDWSTVPHPVRIDRGGGLL
jgi:hypothetical protein